MREWKKKKRVKLINGQLASVARFDVVFILLWESLKFKIRPDFFENIFEIFVFSQCLRWIYGFILFCFLRVISKSSNAAKWMPSFDTILNPVNFDYYSPKSFIKYIQK